MIRLCVLWFPLLLAGAEGDFAGASRCAPCHASIFRSHQPSRHARTLRTVEGASEFTARLPFSTIDRATGAKLTLEKTDAGISLTASNDSDEQVLRLQWAFGSGAQGITCVGKRGDGEPVEARLTWYRSLQSYDLTTGATRHTPVDVMESLGRKLESEELQKCLNCHGGASEMGVQCERCHGPGRPHISAVTSGSSDRRILNPGKLDAFGQVRMCGECHGRPPEDTDITGLRAIENNPNTVRFASPRLVLSRCFNEAETGLKCTDCHNPHEDAARGSAGYDRVCLGCHSKGARRRAAICHTGVEKCSSCHMPVAQVMAHSSFRDHWIRVVSE